MRGQFTILNGDPAFKKKFFFQHGVQNIKIGSVFKSKFLNNCENTVGTSHTDNKSFVS